MDKLKQWIRSESVQNAMIPFIAVILGFLVGAIVIWLTGTNPFFAYQQLLKGAGFSGDYDGFVHMGRLGTTLIFTAPLILTGLSVAFGMRTGLFNIGASGQMLMGGFAAVAVGVLMDLPRFLHMPLAVIVAMIVGALWGFVPGYLKARFNVHEVVVTIMMNWIAVWTVYEFVPRFMRGPFDTESATVAATASLRAPWLSEMFGGSPVNYGLFIAIIAAIVVWFILEKTTFGFELKAVGFNKDAAEYAGIKVNRNIIFSMMIAGALAGLAGSVQYLGSMQSIRIGVLPTLGFDGIAVALLGMNTPIGVVLSSILFGVMHAGKNFMQTATAMQAAATGGSGVPNELVQIIMAVIIFFAASTLLIKSWMKRLGSKKLKSSKNKGGQK